MRDILKIVVIGPESTGKSTLSAALAAQLDTVWNPESAREYLDRLDRPYEETDLLNIAEAQLEEERRLTHHANRYLVCDTDLYVIKVWSEARYGHCDRRILEAIADQCYDLYLLTYIDIPWSPDPQREHPDPRDREYFYLQYRDIVQQSGVAWADIRGTESERLQRSLEAVSMLTGNNQS